VYALPNEFRKTNGRTVVTSADDCSLEDVQYHLYVLEKVHNGLDDARNNGTLSQEQVEARLSQWLTE